MSLPLASGPLPAGPAFRQRRSGGRPAHACPPSNSSSISGTAIVPTSSVLSFPSPCSGPVLGSWHGSSRRRLLAAAPNAKPSSSPSSSNSVNSGGDSALRAGSLVEYRRDADRAALVLLVEPHGKSNWWGVDQAGRRQSVQPKQVSLTLPQGSYKEADLAAFNAAAEAADMNLLEVAWEIAADGGAAMSLTELSELLFDRRDAATLFTTHRMLAADQIYFKQVGKTQGVDAMFEPKTGAQVEAVKKTLEAAAALRRDQEAFVTAVEASLKGKTRAQQPSAETWLQGPHSARVAALTALALTKEGATLAPSTLTLATETLQLLGAVNKTLRPVSVSAALRAAAATFLQDIRVFRYHEPLELLRQGLDLSDLPAALQAKAQALLSHPPPDPAGASRVDLTHLRVATIDDEGTQEVDDGLSVERVKDGRVRFWVHTADPTRRLSPGGALDLEARRVHVADPTRWLSPGDALDLEARRRTRTLYLPWGFIPMFPRALAAGPFSLNEATEGCGAMSVGAELAPDGSIADVQLVASTVRVSQRLTYDDADVLLAREAGEVQEQAEARTLQEDLETLQQAAERRRSYRESQGSIDIPLPEAKIHVPLSDLDIGRPRVQVKRLSQWDSPSRQMVAEMMILAGEAIGLIGSREGLPLPFRGQETPMLPSPSELRAVPAGPCQAHLLRGCMTRSTVASKPQRHASLGLAAYVQFTSPIRRYGDLIAHFQLRSFLNGQPLPFSAGDVDAIMGTTQEEGRALGVLEREQENYWLSEFFRQRSDEVWTATFLGWFREETRLAAVLVSDLGWETITRIENGTEVRPGDEVQMVRVEGDGREGQAPRFRVTGVLRAEGSGEEGGEVVASVEGEGSDSDPDFSEA